MTMSIWCITVLCFCGQTSAESTVAGEVSNAWDGGFVIDINIYFEDELFDGWTVFMELNLAVGDLQVSMACTKTWRLIPGKLLGN